MRDLKITVEPFAFINLLQCDIRKVVNEHVTATVSGIIPNDMEGAYMEMALAGVKSVITARDDSGAEKTVFHGIVRNLSIDTKNELKTLTAELISASYLMDNRPHTRTFQDAAMSYNDVLNFLSTSYTDYGALLTVGNGEPIKDVILQYKETDWQFAKRLASHFNSVLVPAYLVDGVKYYFGLPESRDSAEVRPFQYSLQKAVGEYIYKTDNDVNGLHETDAIYYRVKSREIYDIAQKVSFNGRELYVFEINSELYGSELLHTYALKSLAGFKTRHAYNEPMTGASLTGTIIDVMQDLVKVHVHCDKAQDTATAKWFIYSTAYSTPDGTGWYCMPEIGDTVRLYLPNEKEAEGYIISAVHLLPANNQARQMPDFKSIRNKYDKEVLFKPDSLTFTNNKGMSVQILDDEGINIISDKKITIISDESVAIASTTADVTVTAPVGLFFEQANTKVTLQDHVVMSGAQVVAQE